MLRHVVAHVAASHLLAGCDSCDGIQWLNWLFDQIGHTLINAVKLGAALFLLGALVFRRTLRWVGLAFVTCAFAFYSVIGGGVSSAANMIGRLMPGGSSVAPLIAPASPGTPSPTSTPTP